VIRRRHGKYKCVSQTPSVEGRSATYPPRKFPRILRRGLPAGARSDRDRLDDQRLLRRIHDYSWAVDHCDDSPRHPPLTNN